MSTPAAEVAKDFEAMASKAAGMESALAAVAHLLPSADPADLEHWRAELQHLKRARAHLQESSRSFDRGIRALEKGLRRRRWGVLA